MTESFDNDIAIIGMSGRFAKAHNLDAFWHNLTQGINSTHFADAKELAQSEMPKALLEHPRFVNASLKLAQADHFDAEFFAMAGAEALMMDPQIRLMLQSCYHVVEDAGYDVTRIDCPVGTFCGMSTNSYLMRMLECDGDAVRNNALQHRILNDKDFLATWVAYKLNLNGPAMSVQTACSTSLLAVHMACQSLLNNECDMALAGGVCVESYQSLGYIHTPGSIFAEDGICRPFDANGTGMLNADGIGMVMLKRAAEAIADNDHIYALIKGTAANNDGAAKLSYTSPCVDFQRDVILEALAVADIDPASIGMIEAHGTGTPLGDPAEITALIEAFGEVEHLGQYCAIGSVKANIGHLDTASGVAGLIKAALCVDKGMLVPSINFEQPNPELKLDKSPFYVSREYAPWPASFALRRAGVSSFGVGGTNVHAVIEQAPKIRASQGLNRPAMVVLSGQKPAALAQQKLALAAALENDDSIALTDVEFTQLYGRQAMKHKFAAIANDKKTLIAQLRGEQYNSCFEGLSEQVPVVFMFPGQGSQYVGMSQSLYAVDGDFAADIDRCFAIVDGLMTAPEGFKQVMFSGSDTELNQTEHTQLALFICEYALARHLQRQGVQADGYIGHSLGEYVAACLSGCLSLSDALELVYHRGRLMASMDKGAMLSVKATQQQLDALLLDGVSVCAYNSPQYLVLGGPSEMVAKQQQVLMQAGIDAKMLAVSHAFHSEMMTPTLELFAPYLAKVQFNSVPLPMFSTLTGQAIDSDTLGNAQYWLDQLRNPVRFGQALESAKARFPNALFVEVGPGRGLSALAKDQLSEQANTVTLLGSRNRGALELNELVESLAKLWLAGAAFHGAQNPQGRRISLPGYAFQTQSYFKPKGIGHQRDLFEEVAELNTLKVVEDKVPQQLRSAVSLTIDNNANLSSQALAALEQSHHAHVENLNSIVADFHLGQASGSLGVKWQVTANQGQSQVDAADDEPLMARSCSAVFVAPSTETQQVLAKHWQALLGYQPVGILDDYFDVGGNSLIATNLMSRVMDELQVELSFADLASCQNIEQLAKHIESKQWLVDISDDFDVDEDSDEVFEL